MKRFRFSLQALQTLREQQEQVALERYAQALQAFEHARGRRDTVRHELEAGWQQCQHQLSAGTTGPEYTQLQGYCRSVEASLLVAERQVQTAQDGVKRSWDQLIQARRHREVVDQCHQRQRRRYDREVRCTEQKLLDEVANRPASDATASKMNLNQLLW